MYITHLSLISQSHYRQKGLTQINKEYNYAKHLSFQCKCWGAGKTFFITSIKAASANTKVPLYMWVTYFAMSMYPQEAAACSGIQPSLSGWLMLAPFCTRNITMSTLSSMQACGDGEDRALSQPPLLSISCPFCPSLPSTKEPI